MVGLRLLDEARAAGLSVTADGERLVIRGPKRAASVARRLIAGKSDVMAALAARDHMRQSCPLGEIAESSDDFVPAWEDCPEVPAPCPRCASVARWWNSLGESRCLSCEPPNAAWTLLRRVRAIREQGTK